MLPRTYALRQVVDFFISSSHLQAQRRASARLTATTMVSGGKVARLAGRLLGLGATTLVVAVRASPPSWNQRASSTTAAAFLQSSLTAAVRPRRSLPYTATAESWVRPVVGGRARRPVGSSVDDNKSVKPLAMAVSVLLHDEPVRDTTRGVGCVTAAAALHCRATIIVCRTARGSLNHTLRIPACIDDHSPWSAPTQLDGGVHLFALRMQTPDRHAGYAHPRVFPPVFLARYINILVRSRFSYVPAPRSCCSYKKDLLRRKAAVHEPRGTVVHKASHSVDGEGQRGPERRSRSEVQPRRDEGPVGEHQHRLCGNDLRRHPGL